MKAKRWIIAGVLFCACLLVPREMDRQVLSAGWYSVEHTVIVVAHPQAELFVIEI